MNDRDPGWSPALKGFLLFSIPFLKAGRSSGRKEPGVLALRSIFLALILALLLFPLVLSYTVPLGAVGFSGPPGWWALGILAAGVAGQVYLGSILRRRLPTQSRSSTAAAYRSRFFVGIGLSEYPTLLGFAGAFIVDALWVYFVGLGLTLFGFFRVAPSRPNLERIDRDLSARGARFSIYDALLDLPATP